MASYSVARSEGDASGPEALPYQPTEQLSFTYAFQSVAITNNLYLFADTEIRDTRIYLGEGATSTVYKTSIAPSSRKIPSQIVAIKQKRRRGSWFDNDVSLESWLRSCYLDVRIMAHHGLQEAKNVAPAIGYFWERVEVDGIQRLSPCLAMPAAAEGMSSLDAFFGMIRAVGGRTTLPTKLLLAHQIANGVRELHRCGIVHGDLKLANILMFQNIVGDTTELIAKVSDFSHSIVLDDYKEAPEHRIPLYRGTRPFLIPEVRLQDQFMNDPSKMAHISGMPKVPLSRYTACDVYALGLVLFSVFMDGITLFDSLQDLFKSMSINDDNMEKAFDILSADVDISAFLQGFVIESCPGLDDTTGPDVGKCLGTCLQDDPSARGEASTVCRILARHIPTIAGPEGGAQEADDQIPDRSVPELISLSELAMCFFLRLPPPLPDLLQAQIFSEAVSKRNNPAYTFEAERFLAICHALGFGTPADLAQSLEHLANVAKVRSTEFLMLWEAVATAFCPDTSLDELRIVMDLTAFKTLQGPSGNPEDPMSGKAPTYTNRVQRLKLLGFNEIIARYEPGPTQQEDQSVYLLSDEEEDHAEKSRDMRMRKYTPQGLKTVWPPPESISEEESDPSLAVDTSLEAPAKSLQELLDFVGQRVKSTSTNSAEETFELLQAVANLLKIYETPLSLFETALTFYSHDTSADGQQKTVQCLSAVVRCQGTEDINKCSAGFPGEPLLVQACRLGQALAAKYLLDQGADPCTSDLSGITALHWLALFDDEDMETVAKGLVQAGADLNAQTTRDMEYDGHCLYFNVGSSPLHFAVAMRSLAAVKVLIDEGADPTQTAMLKIAFHEHQITSLHLAISLHFYEIVEYLISLPGTTPYVMYNPWTFDNTARPTSMIHLVGMRATFNAHMSPFARFVMHGQEYEEAVDKTLEAILAVFPEKKVLDLARNVIFFQPLPAEDPWIMEAIQRHGFIHVDVPPDELRQAGHQAAAVALQRGESYESYLWWRCGVEVACLKKSCRLPLDTVLNGIDLDTIDLDGTDFIFLLDMLQLCVPYDLDGPLRSMLERVFTPPPPENWRIAWGDVVMEFVFFASKNDAVDALGILFEYMTQKVNWTPTKFLNFKLDGITALHAAAASNSTRSISFLLEKGAEKDLHIGPCGTPLAFAAESFKTRDAAVLLLREKASIFCNKSEGPGYTVLHAAVATADVSLKGEQQFSGVKILLETFPEKFFAEIDGVKILNLKDKKGYTVLHYAVIAADVRTVAALLELRDVDIGAVDNNGWTPLMWAVVYARLRTASPEGATMVIRNTTPNTRRKCTIKISEPEQEWLVQRHYAIVKLLLEAGSPEPEREPMTNEYNFLLSFAVRLMFRGISTPGWTRRTTAIARNFPFASGHGPKGEPACIMTSQDKKTIMIFPEGAWTGCRALIYTLKQDEAAANYANQESGEWDLEAELEDMRATKFALDYYSTLNASVDRHTEAGSEEVVGERLRELNLTESDGPPETKEDDQAVSASSPQQVESTIPEKV